VTEIISVYTPENSDKLVGLLFQNRHGAFAREDRRWVVLDPADTRFDGLEVNDVKPENTDEVLAVFDSGEGMLTDIRGMYVQDGIDEFNYEEASK
jgi:hypothetical protein